MRIASTTITRCDVCGLQKPSQVAGWRNIGLSYRSEDDSNDSNKVRQWNKHYPDLCPKCYKMMVSRIVDSLTWATTL